MLLDLGNGGGNAWGYVEQGLNDGDYVEVRKCLSSCKEISGTTNNL